MINTRIDNGAYGIEQLKLHFIGNTSQNVAITFDENHSTYFLLPFVVVASHPSR